MRAYVIFSSSEPTLIVTRQTIRSKTVLDHLGRIGIDKFIAREVPISPLRIQYGRQFDIIEDAIQKGSDLRVLDFSGSRIFRNLPFSKFGPAYRQDSSPAVTDPSPNISRSGSWPELDPVSPAGFG